MFVERLGSVSESCLRPTARIWKCPFGPFYTGKEGPGSLRHHHNRESSSRAGMSHLSCGLTIPATLEVKGRAVFASRASEWTSQSSLRVTEASTTPIPSSFSTPRTFPSSCSPLWCPTCTSSPRCCQRASVATCWSACWAPGR